METLDLVRTLTDAFGPPGFEDDARAVVRALVEPFADEVREDVLGTLVAVVRGRSERVVMLDAHLDEIGLIVNYLDEDGFVRFAALGGWDDRILLAQRVVIRTRDGRRVPGVIGIAPPHLQSKEQRERVIKIEDMFIDVGAKTRDEVAELGVRVGDPAVVAYPLERLAGDTVTAKALDNRAGCAVAVRVLERLAAERPELTVAVTFTACEEVGGRGARTATFDLAPAVALVLEGTIGANVPGIEPRKQPVVLGRGPAISIADSSIVVRPKVVAFLERLAEEGGIPWQHKMPPYSGTNAGVIHIARGGTLTGVLSVPCRYIHSPVSTMRLEEFEQTVALAEAFVRRAHELLE
ncbi:MAG: M42 family metallopeptidase [Verrucomicrobia bacterium]|nr:M42 family metallopeptidase [Verrucomicrobiota bacterium]